MTVRLRRVLRCAATAAAVLGALTVAPAWATTETASQGSVQATFSYTKGAEEGQWTGLRLQVTRDGQVAFDGVPTARDCESPYCAPYGVLPGAHSLTVADLEADSEPEVIVDLYSGGAHCCEISEVYRWDGTTYAPVSRFWGNVGYKLDLPPLTDPPIFVSADDRFSYAFASFADSRFPAQLFAFRAGAFVDVTREHRDTIVADAKRQLRGYLGRRKGLRSLGFLAAWVADEYLLGEQAAADRYLTRELRAGRLRGDKEWPRGKAYIRVLKRRLKAWGYA